MRKGLKNKAFILLTLAAIAASVFMSGCSRQNTNTGSSAIESSAQAVTFTDALGRSVTVRSADRVASLLGSFSEVWTLAGGKLVASVDDAWSSFDLGLPDDAVKLGAILEPNTELLIASRPDFVIASSNTEPDVAMRETLENAGITVAYFDINNFDDYLNMLNICTDITGRKDLYEKNGTSVRDEIERAKARIDGSSPKVLLLRAASKNVKVKGSDDTVGGSVLKDLGCINIADSDKSLIDDLSLEAIVKADPDYIFVMVQGSNVDAALKNVDTMLKDSPAWSSLTAVKNNRYYVLDKALYTLKPNARWGESYIKMADILYPQKQE
ncbi:MAG: ABC transporter substrate-binding protein [[Bacteroides] pectinophilus]|nr:ABC transporter substrate-binding protein [[Bacteroides] pectinophilus]